MPEYWGYHLVLDCKNGRKLNEDSEEDIRVFIKELVNKIVKVISFFLKDLIIFGIFFTFLLKYLFGFLIFLCQDL